MAKVNEDELKVYSFSQQVIFSNPDYAFFNSTTCNKLIRTINPSANNPANYIKKIPFIAPSDKQNELINATIQTILESIATQGHYDVNAEIKLNKIFEQIYGF